MTIDEATAKINEAPVGEAHKTALDCIQELSEGDRLIAADDLEEMAILIDNE